MIQADPLYKKTEFRNFLLNRNPSKRFADKYITYLGSALVTNATKRIANVDNIYKVTTMNKLNDIYIAVKADTNNIRLHNIYSGVVSAYIKFLNGQDLRKRVLPTDK